MKKLLIALTLVCSSVAFAQNIRMAEVEPLMGAQINSNSIRILVYSGGCTSKRSFGVAKRFDESTGLVEVTFLRLVPDNCEAYWPEGRILTFWYSDLDLRSNEAIRIGNPFVSRR